MKELVILLAVRNICVHRIDGTGRAGKTALAKLAGVIYVYRLWRKSCTILLFIR